MAWPIDERQWEFLRHVSWSSDRTKEKSGKRQKHEDELPTQEEEELQPSERHLAPRSDGNRQSSSQLIQLLLLPVKRWRSPVSGRFFEVHCESYCKEKFSFIVTAARSVRQSQHYSDELAI
jgi:hypothetical protein